MCVIFFLIDRVIIIVDISVTKKTPMLSKKKDVYLYDPFHFPFEQLLASTLYQLLGFS
jgi:hypothetical protein